MIGNVSEWCLGPIAGEVAKLYQDPNAFQRAVLRGGSYVHTGSACRATWRDIGKRDGSGDLDGFRPMLPGIPQPATASAAAR